MADRAVIPELGGDVARHHVQRGEHLRLVGIVRAQRLSEHLGGVLGRHRRHARGMGAEHLLRGASCLDEGRSRAVGHRPVERISGRRDADQDQHDEAHALLPVIAAMRERDGGAGEDQQPADMPGRRLIGLGLLVELGIGDDPLHQPQQHHRADEAEDRAHQQGQKHAFGLPPFDARGAAGAARQPLVGEADAQDRSDQRVAGGIGQPQPPGAEVPHHCRDQKREDHRIAARAADVEDQLDRQKGDDAVRDGAARQHDADEVPAARPDHRGDRRQRMGVDHRRHRIGGVVEAVHEFEAERDQQREAQEQEGADSELLADMRRIIEDIVAREDQPGTEHGEEADRGERMDLAIERNPGLRRRIGSKRLSRHANLLSRYRDPQCVRRQ